MLGVILCGGESRRMGLDKGLLKINSRSWAEIAAGKLANLQIPVVLSVNKLQTERYTLEIPHLQLVVDQDQLKIKGPLCGVLSVHSNYPKEDLFVLACDMLNMDQQLLEQVMDANERNSGFDSYIYSNGINPEPLCGIYKAGFLNLIIKKLSSGQLSRNGMKFALEQGQIFSLEIPEATQKYFQSYNTQEESGSWKPKD